MGTDTGGFEGHGFSRLKSGDTALADVDESSHCTPIKGNNQWFLTVFFRKIGWLVIIISAVVVYAGSFSNYPIIEKKYDVLADADAANFVFLLKEFRIDKQLGNQWNAQHRSIADNAQKHKIHHVLYAAFGHVVYATLAPVYKTLGLGSERAVYGVNAVIAGINIILLLLLLRRNNPNENPLAPFVLFYCIALNTWIYSSIPESWPFSATLVLCFILLLQIRPLRPVLTGAVLGLIMLNNVFLAALASLVVLVFIRENRILGKSLRQIVVAGIVTIMVWLGGLTLLSFFDQGFRPDQFVRYTLWFKQFTNPGLPKTDPYVWKSAGTNLLINSIVSNQPDPRLPQEALQYTFRTSLLGIVATGCYLLLLGVVFASYLRSAVTAIRSEGIRGLIEIPSTTFVLWCMVMLGVTVILYYPSGFLYSTIVVPVIAILLCRQINLRVPWQRVLMFTTIAVALANNLDQIIKFRQALSVLG